MTVSRPGRPEVLLNNIRNIGRNRMPCSARSGAGCSCASPLRVVNSFVLGVSLVSAFTQYRKRYPARCACRLL